MPDWSGGRAGRAITRAVIQAVFWTVLGLALAVVLSFGVAP